MRDARQSSPRLLVTDREQAVFLQRARIHADHGRVFYRTREDDLQKDFAVPHANLALLFLGQGTSITQEAARLLGEEGVFVAFTGTDGAPLFHGALTSYTGTSHFRRMLTAYADPDLSLEMARSLMGVRLDMMCRIGVDLAEDICEIDDVSGIEKACAEYRRKLPSITSIPELLGHEGDYARRLYAIFARESGIKDFVRTTERGAKPDPTPVGRANALIDHGNYLAYGYAGAALWALGIPPHMPVFHGKTRAGGLVFDLADTFKEAFVLPIAFAGGAGRLKGDPETAFRAKLMRNFDTHKILGRAIEVMNATLPKERLGAHLNPGQPPKDD